MRKLKITSLFISAFVISTSLTPFIPSGTKAHAATISSNVSQTARQMEYLDRGLMATKVNDGVYVGWRLLGTDDPNISFNIYRQGAKINSEPITNSTNYLDHEGNLSSSYFVKAIVNGIELSTSESVTPSSNPYLSVPLQIPEGGTTPDGVKYTYDANDGSVGDVDGDGKYEYIVKWMPSNSRDNVPGFTGETILDAYKLDGTLLWRIHLGKNIASGAHYSPFLVYDFDGDGKAEVVFRTADGTIDGTGKVIGDKNADYRTEKGSILSGPEYLTVFNGQTGAAMTSLPFSPERGSVSDWGDSYGNRVDRFLACVAYLDGVHPSIVMTRGYYVKTCLSAYDFKDGKLVPRWNFTADGEQNSNYRGRGNHNLSVVDVDNDKRDEIVYGSCTIDDNGKGLYQTGLSHGDALHVGDLDPTRDGLEVFQVHEEKSCKYNADVRDAKTGEVLWGVKVANGDCGRGVAADIDPRYPGEEVWGAKQIGLFTIKGEKIADAKHAPTSMNFAGWWDGDLSRELVDDNKIYKWDYENGKMNTVLDATDCASNNTTKANPVLQADLFGDWREEVVWRTKDNKELRIYSTTDVTNYRLDTLMHDSVYRLGVAWQNVGYNQPPHTSYFLGTGMKTPPKSNIYTVANKISKLNLPDSIDVNQGEKVNLPQTVTATLGNGTQSQVTILWDDIDTSKVGQASITGTIKETNDTVTETVNVLSKTSKDNTAKDTNINSNTDNAAKADKTSNVANVDNKTTSNATKTSDNNPIILAIVSSLMALTLCFTMSKKKKISK